MVDKNWSPLQAHFTKILDLVQSNKRLKFGDLVKKTKLNPRTLKKYLEIIQLVQNNPPLHIKKEGTKIFIFIEAEKKPDGNPSEQSAKE